MKRLIPIILALMVIGISPVVSLAGEIEDAQEWVRLNPGNAEALYKLGYFYSLFRRHQEAIAPLKEAIRLKPDYANAHYNLGNAYEKLGRNNEAIAEYKEALRHSPKLDIARNDLN